MYQENQFVFAPEYRLLRHLLFWVADALVFTFVFRISDVSIGEQMVISFIWVPLHMLYAYPVMYIFIPHILLKEKYVSFIATMLLWGIAGWFWNYVCRQYVYFGFIERFSTLNLNGRNPWAANSYMSMVVVTGVGCTVILFKYWTKKQRDFLNAEREKIHAELQLLKAQIHPHFLFNTLNNIYSFSMKGSEKAPSMITKLSSLLSYILYDCKSSEVPLEQEIEVMKNYIDLEKERYGNKLEISINIEGDIQGKFVAPLLLLPFIENAFKHGTSELLEKPWLSIDISVRQSVFYCKILNSKNLPVTTERKGIGIENVRKRLKYLYNGKHDLKLNSENDFFVVSLMIELSHLLPTVTYSQQSTIIAENPSS